MHATFPPSGQLLYALTDFLYQMLYVHIVYIELFYPHVLIFYVFAVHQTWLPCNHTGRMEILFQDGQHQCGRLGGLVVWMFFPQCSHLWPSPWNDFLWKFNVCLGPFQSHLEHVDCFSPFPFILDFTFIFHMGIKSSYSMLVSNLQISYWYINKTLFVAEFVIRWNSSSSSGT